jgi:hypothetical protein
MNLPNFDPDRLIRRLARFTASPFRIAKQLDPPRGNPRTRCPGTAPNDAY